MEQFTHEEVHVESDINVRFELYESVNDFVPEHWHRSMEIIYIYEGEMDVTVDRRRRRLSAGDFAVINTAAIHATRTYEYARVQLLQIPYQFLAQAIPGYDHVRFDLTAGPDAGTCAAAPGSELPAAALRRILTDMGQLYARKPLGYSLRFSSLLYEFLYTLVSHYQVSIDNTAKVQSQKNLERLAPVIRYVKEHYADLIPLEDAAALASLNPEYFCRFFKRNMGTTFTAYVNSVRLTHVFQDLKNTDLNIGVLLERHGVTNYKLFMRNFKQTYGCTPKQFRRNL
ncbi:MAG: AraC family transcriptional regulator [Lachnospiraceae bacterium]|nr:AraC family transcriptional regulator [Lachnospiraceae bacterium]